jgi:glycosyltransferase involved in cell wall biosynthesis
MKLSIIVPVFKVEKYLDKCIRSILAQTFADFELILVDDGSPDSCGEKCEDWAAKDQRIKVIHKNNGGLSDARNAGIDIASGDYIGFVDSDDYIKPDMFEILVSNLEANDADISICGYVDVYANGQKNESLDKSVYVWQQEEAIRQILLGKLLSVHAWTKLYKRELFSSVRYPVGKISEDAYIIMDIMDQVKIAAFTPYSAYYYVHREGSINTGKYKEIDKTRVEAHEKNYHYIVSHFPELKTLAHDRYLGAVSFVAHKMAFSGVTEKEDVDCENLFSILRKEIINVYKSEYFSSKRKMSISILLISKKLYKFAMKRVYKIHE